MKTYCYMCGRALNEIELDAPYTHDGNVYCDFCWFYEFHFECAACRELDHIDLQHFYLVVAEVVKSDVGGSVPAGIYYVKNGPYYGGGLIGEHYLIWHAILRLRDLPRGLESAWYPCGHLCSNCVAGLGLGTTERYMQQIRKTYG